MGDLPELRQVTTVAVKLPRGDQVLPRRCMVVLDDGVVLLAIPEDAAEYTGFDLHRAEYDIPDVCASSAIASY